jgi:hypothetical protein
MAGCIPTVLRRGVGLFLQKSITLGATRPASRSSTHLKGRGVVDLYGAATQFFGTPTWITLGAALLISTTAFIVMLVYVRAVDPKSKPGKKMPQPGPVVQGGTPPLVQLPTGSLEIQTEKPGGPRSLPPPRSPTFQHAKTAFRRAACFYTLRGLLLLVYVGMLPLIGLLLELAGAPRLPLARAIGCRRLVQAGVDRPPLSTHEVERSDFPSRCVMAVGLIVADPQA